MKCSIVRSTENDIGGKGYYIFPVVVFVKWRDETIFYFGWIVWTLMISFNRAPKGGKSDDCIGNSRKILKR